MSERNLKNAESHALQLSRRAVLGTAGACALASSLPRRALAFGAQSEVEVRVLEVDGKGAAYQYAPSGIAWEMRKRTNVVTRADPSTVRFDDPALFRTPFLYWSGTAGFPPLSEEEIRGLRSFVEHGGFLWIDDANPQSEAFDAAVRRTLARAFIEHPLSPLSRDHVVFRTFYLVDAPMGRVVKPPHVYGIKRGREASVIYTRQDVGGAVARDKFGNFEVAQISEVQRDQAIRFAVNIIMYALCIDYKDDQVHAPFLMRRRRAP